MTQTPTDRRPPDAVPNALYDRGASLLRTLYRRRLATPALLDAPGCFPSAPRFVGAWRALRAEALAIARDLGSVPRFHEIMPEQADISNNDGRDWRLFIAKAYGVSVKSNLQLCKTLVSLLRDAPEVLSASFSYLAPGKQVPRHQGPFGGVLRFHLALDTPLDAAGRPAAVLEIDGVEHRLGDGEWLLWDDTFPHAVWNAGETVRAVLLLDVWRPDMPADLRLLSRAVIGAMRLGIRRRGLAGRA
jgi:aspartate beta-hydroxylase